MIITFLLNIINNFVYALLSVLPLSTGYDSKVLAAVDTVLGYVDSFNILFPLGTLIQIVMAYITFVELPIFIFKTVRWVVSVVRGS